jgi:hypothetical protein
VTNGGAVFVNGVLMSGANLEERLRNVAIRLQRLRELERQLNGDTAEHTTVLIEAERHVTWSTLRRLRASLAPGMTWHFVVNDGL